MARVLNSKDFANQLVELSHLDLDVSEARGLPVIQQTKRNLIRRELLDGMLNTLEKMFTNENEHAIANLYSTEKGIAIEVENESIGKQVEDGNGMITMILDIKFKDLSYDAMIESDAYLEEKRAKAEKKAAKEEAKAKKIAADKARKASKGE